MVLLVQRDAVAQPSYYAPPTGTEQRIAASLEPSA